MKMTFILRIFLPVICCGMINVVHSQEFLPALNDNYMGINQALLQPASIADSRFKVDINFLGFSTDVYNDMLRINPMDFVKNNYSDYWEDYNYTGSVNGRDKNAIASQSALMPGFMVTLSPKHALGFTYRARNIMNFDDISEPLARSFVKQYELSEHWNQWYYDKELRAINHMFADYGLTYAREIIDLDKHYLKGGVTLKLLQGLAAAQIQASDYYYYLYRQANEESAEYISINSPFVEYGVSGNWNWGSEENGRYPGDFDYKFIGKPSVGLDLGVVYEFRPEREKYYYDMDGEYGLDRLDQNKYLLKVGFSVLDIGRLRYDKEYLSRNFSAGFTPDYLQRYNSGNNAIPFNTSWMEIGGEKFGVPPWVNFSDSLDRREDLGHGVSWAPENEGSFKIKLPTAISLQVDYHVVKGLYVNLTTYTALHQSLKNPGNSHYMSNYSITPRYEHKWFSVMVPVQYNQFDRMDIGLGIRAAFLYMGMNNLFNAIFGGDMFGTGIYMGLKIPIWYGKPPKDFDKDGVSDKYDRCPDLPGIWDFRGCPDRDGDGVPDAEDECPDIAGLKEFRGCPDRDGDGVPDKDDLCPDQPGPKLTQGCPDRDGDGVMDIQDECPDEHGPVVLNGCPDRDGDGVPDYKDRCPDVAGKVEFGGCPFLDTDNDGVKDEDDRCPTIPGPPENFGCPWTDTDGDGVPDKDDRCPLTPGSPDNFGCPIIEEKEAVILKTAFENLEFETGKAVIRSSSFKSLDELAALLISKPAWKLRISGHTDNVGSDESNMKLSKDRAQSTAKYLQGKGVDGERLVAEWFGESQPIADNATAEGRQKNRRVEMVVEFD